MHKSKQQNNHMCVSVHKHSTDGLPVYRDGPHNQQQQYAMFRLAQRQRKQHKLWRHDDRETLCDVPVPWMRPVERALTREDVELEEIVSHKHPITVETAIKQWRHR